MTITINLTLEELAILNDFIQNSSPSVKFGQATVFVANIQKQIKQQIEKQNERSEN